MTPPPGDHDPIETNNWEIPFFCKNAADVLVNNSSFNNLFPNREIEIIDDSDESIFKIGLDNIQVSRDVLDLASDMLRDSEIPAWEGRWDTGFVSQSPEHQIGLLIALSWRRDTIRTELKGRQRGVHLIVDDQPRLPDEDDLDVIDFLHSFQRGEFPDLLEFTLIQSRREEMQQKLFSTIEKDLYLGDEPDYENEIFKPISFRSKQDLDSFMDNYWQIITDDALLRQVRENSPESLIQEKVALQLYCYIHFLTNPAIETDSQNQIRNYLERNSSDSEVNPRELLLKRVGIPYYPEYYPPNPNHIGDFQNSADYIGRYFSGMNYTHLGRE